MSEAIKVRIGGGWRRKDKDGNVVALEVPLTRTSKIVLFPNDRQRPDSRDPDFTAYLYPVEKKKEDEGSGQ